MSSTNTVVLLRPGQSPTEHHALRWYVGAAPTGAPVDFVSSYHAALRDARNTTGRDGTGAVTLKGEDNTGTWIGAVGYLTFLDQVGTAVTLKGRRRKPGRGTSPIEWSLRDFATHLTRRDREALYALRCSLAHDFSLFNKGRGPRARELHFHFGLHIEPHRPLVEHAPRRWDGNYTPEPRESCRTWVNLRALGDLAEDCHRAVQTAFRGGQLVARLTPREIALRYTIGMYDDGLTP